MVTSRKKVQARSIDTLSVALGRFAVSGEGRGATYVPLIVAMVVIATLISTVLITNSAQSVASRLNPPVPAQKASG